MGSATIFGEPAICHSFLFPAANHAGNVDSDDQSVFATLVTVCLKFHDASWHVELIEGGWLSVYPT